MVLIVTGVRLGAFLKAYSYLQIPFALVKNMLQTGVYA